MAAKKKVVKKTVAKAKPAQAVTDAALVSAIQKSAEKAIKGSIRDIRFNPFIEDSIDEHVAKVAMGWIRDPANKAFIEAEVAKSMQVVIPRLCAEMTKSLIDHTKNFLY